MWRNLFTKHTPHKSPSFPLRVDIHRSSYAFFNPQKIYIELRCIKVRKVFFWGLQAIMVHILEFLAIGTDRMTIKCLELVYVHENFRRLNSFTSLELRVQ